MTERDDGISRRYRGLAREEPPPALDAAILAAARASGPSRFAKWAGPVSIAAVLVLGIGVSLRMQTESPGIETRMPASEYAAPSMSETPAAPEAAIAPAPKPAPGKTRAAPAQQAFRADPAPAPAPAEEPLASRSESPGASLGMSAAPRAKREAMRDSAGERAAADALTAQPDPARELERIAKLRAEGAHADADRALEAFRRAHPDYRIPEAMWERVRHPSAPPREPPR